MTAASLSSPEVVTYPKHNITELPPSPKIAGILSSFPPSRNLETSLLNTISTPSFHIDNLEMASHNLLDVITHPSRTTKDISHLLLQWVHEERVEEIDDHLIRALLTLSSDVATPILLQLL